MLSPVVPPCPARPAASVVAPDFPLRPRRGGWRRAGLAAGLGLLTLGGASKHAAPLAVRFHAEANANDTSTFSMPVSLGGDPPRQVVVERIPSISERDIVAVFPFPARGGGSFGVEFQLGDHGRLTLQNLTVAHRGGLIVTMVNGRPLVPLTVDRMVADGLIVVPYGFTEREARELEETFPHVGQPPGSRPARRPGAN